MSASITVPGYNTANRLPGFYFALDSSKANTASVARRVLIVAQMLASGNATPMVATVSAGPTDAIAKYGAGSQAAIMVAAYRQIDTVGEVWVLPLMDDTASSAATGVVSITGPASVSGSLPFYIGDQLVPVAVNAGDTASIIASNLKAAAASQPNLPVTIATNGTAGQLVVTARNKGLSGNDIVLNTCLLGTAGGQALPAGVSVTTPTMAGGEQNPTTLASALAGLGTRVFDLIAYPYSDSGSLDAVEGYLSFATGTWSPNIQQYGVGFSAYRGTYGAATALNPDYNQGPIGMMMISDSPSSPMKWAAWCVAAAAVTMRTNPALPITGIAIPALPPSDAGTLVNSMRESLLYDGFSTFTVQDGQVFIERLITCCQTNSQGVPDDSYLDIETLLTAEVCFQDMRIQLASQLGGSILLADGTKLSAGAKATTAQLVGKTAAAIYRQQAANLWVQNPDQFAAGVQAVNNGNGFVSLFLPYQFANQFWGAAGVAQFTKP